MPSADNTKAESLLDEGRLHLDAGDMARAEAKFRAAAAISDLPAARNNWALCRYLADAHAEALEILAPILADAAPAPFARALASRALTELGQRESATRELNAAIRDLDASFAAAQRPQGVLATAWVEYTMLVKQAAGELGLDHLVLDLHGRWPGRDLPAGAFAAGVAAFHLGRYAQAAKYWRRIAAPGWSRLMGAYATVAEWVDAGMVPSFRLEYDFHNDVHEAGASADDAMEIAGRGGVRVRMLASLFEPDSDDKASLTASLIAVTGDWGVDLAQRLLAGTKVPLPLKMGAARALVSAGVLAPNTPIPVVLEGRPTTILIKAVDIQEESAEAQTVVDNARLLRDAGKHAEALALLDDLTFRNVLYPPAMMMQANLMRTLGNLDGARNLLETLEKYAPDDPGVLFNLTGLWMQYRDVERARSYASRIDTADTSPEFKRMLAQMKEQLRQFELFASPPTGEEIATAMREEIEEKPISLNVRLAPAVKQVPVQWLNAAATHYGLAPTKRRAEREKALAAQLQDPERLRALLAAESDDVRAALQYLIEAGGWCKLPALTKRFGSLDPDGFFWDEQLPTSAIGRLRLLGLVFIGRAVIDGRRYKVAVIPADLRGALAAAV
ncbi:MAG: hypothetical protein JWN15_676 [Firmicutes bacterium]|nr:hypothetical protein [Bacillota bacterium]